MNPVFEAPTDLSLRTKSSSCKEGGGAHSGGQPPALTGPSSPLGPDICGPGTKKVHVIFNYKGKNVLINKDIRCKVSLGVVTKGCQGRLRGQPGGRGHSPPALFRTMSSHTCTR